MSAYAPEQQQAETEVVSGQVVGIITKAADKWQVSVNTGGQYAKNLWTKDAGLVNQMQGAIGQSFDFICGASHWQGQNGPVRSLWINSVAMFGSTPATPTQLPAQQPQTQAPQQQAPSTSAPVQGMPTLSPMEKDMRIMREHAMGVVAQMLPYMPVDERNAQGMVRVAEGLIRYYQQGPSAFPQQQQPPQQLPPQGEYIPVAAQDGGDWQGGQPSGDDEIPF